MVSHPVVIMSSKQGLLAVFEPGYDKPGNSGLVRILSSESILKSSMNKLICGSQHLKVKQSDRLEINQ